MGENQIDMDDVADGLQDNFQKTYGWFLVINRITENDFTKHEYVYQKKLIEVLNQLSYLIDYDREQERLQKKAMSKM
jgi:hypothetical protein